MATLRDLLEDTYRRRGALTDKILVEEARNEGHPLHHRIWDKPDSEAAYEWRLAEARSIIRSVKIVVADGDAPRDLRAWLATREPEGSGTPYQPTDEIMLDPIAGEIILRQFRRDMKAMERRYGHMKEYRAWLIERAAQLDDDEEGTA